MLDEGALQLVTPPCNDGRPVLHVSDPRDFDADLTAPRLLSLLLGTKPAAPEGHSNGGFNFPVTQTWPGPTDLSYDRAQRAAR
jgi:hypothetical protein